MSYKLKLRWQVHIDDDLDRDASETSISSARQVGGEVLKFHGPDQLLTQLGHVTPPGVGVERPPGGIRTRSRRKETPQKAGSRYRLIAAGDTTTAKRFRTSNRTPNSASKTGENAADSWVGFAWAFSLIGRLPRAPLPSPICNYEIRLATFRQLRSQRGVDAPFRVFRLRFQALRRDSPPAG